NALKLLDHHHCFVMILLEKFYRRHIRLLSLLSKCFHYSCRIAPNIGECRVSKTLPPPKNMCTPHGRQGSKLRTARIMSTPLNLSRGFSSKIGVCWIASSYGPGVP